MTYRVIHNGTKIICDTYIELDNLLSLLRQQKENVKVKSVKKQSYQKRTIKKLVSGTNQERVFNFLLKEKDPADETTIAKKLRISKSKVHYALRNLRQRGKKIMCENGLWKTTEL